MLSGTVHGGGCSFSAGMSTGLGGSGQGQRVAKPAAGRPFLAGRCRTGEELSSFPGAFLVATAGWGWPDCRAGSSAPRLRFLSPVTGLQGLLLRIPSPLPACSCQGLRASSCHSSTSLSKIQALLGPCTHPASRRRCVRVCLCVLVAHSRPRKPSQQSRPACLRAGGGGETEAAAGIPFPLASARRAFLALRCLRLLYLIWAPLGEAPSASPLHLCAENFKGHHSPPCQSWEVLGGGRLLPPLLMLCWACVCFSKGERPGGELVLLGLAEVSASGKQWAYF